MKNKGKRMKDEREETIKGRNEKKDRGERKEERKNEGNVERWRDKWR